MTALLAAFLAIGHVGVNYGQAYEPLLDCYVGFMNSKGVTLSSKRSDDMRWDTAARRHCDVPYSNLEQQVGSAKARRAWRGLWSENSARD